MSKSNGLIRETQVAHVHLLLLQFQPELLSIIATQIPVIVENCWFSMQLTTKYFLLFDILNDYNSRFLEHIICESFRLKYFAMVLSNNYAISM